MGPYSETVGTKRRGVEPCNNTISEKKKIDNYVDERAKSSRKKRNVSERSVQPAQD